MIFWNEKSLVLLNAVTRDPQSFDFHMVEIVKLVDF